MIPVHPAAALLPRMTEEERTELVEDIRQNGQRVPIILHNGMILDGRNRWEACDVLGIEPKTQEWESNGQSPVIWVLSMNVKRRHLNAGQKAMISHDALPLLEEEARQRQQIGREVGSKIAAERRSRNSPCAPFGAQDETETEHLNRGQQAMIAVDMMPLMEEEKRRAEERGDIPPGRRLLARPQSRRDAIRAVDQAATITGASGRSVSKAKRVQEADPELAEKVRQGEVSLNSAEHTIREREKQQQAQERAQQTERIAVRDVRIEVADATAMPLQDNSVDVIWTSPPYGLNKDYDGQEDEASAWVAFMDDFLREALRVTVETGRLVLNVPLDTTSGGYRPTWPQACQLAVAAGWTYRTTIVWNKANSTKGNRGLGSLNSADAPHPIAEVEIIGLFSKGAWKRATPGTSDMTPEEWQEWSDGVWIMPGETRPWEGHPAPFSERLTDRVLRYLSRLGETVLDPFCGSGTTPLVAWKLKRNPIAFDTSEAFVASTTRRLAKAQEEQES